ncbi:fimbrial protein [Dyella sedimenti]|uniref:fimbrial protein n=1 Tax=Dyella sedimenti TaxID=2919947 RepID=UPI001FA96663|nr:fimbrial protein [Dyella sedimenti]
MKNALFLAALVAATGMAMLYPGRVPAYDGTMVISGNVIDSTCNITGGGAATGNAGSITIKLPGVSLAAIQNQSHAGDTPFSLVLSGANCANGKMVSLWIEPTVPNSITPSGTLSNIQGGSGFASGVEVELVNPANDNRINLAVNASIDGASGNVIAGNNQPVATIAGNTASLDYVARYYNPGTGSITPGQVLTYLAFSLQYN